jgi:hypothetical protein
VRAWRVASQALNMALSNPAQVFGLPGPTLQVGGPDDLIQIDTERPEMQPSHSLSTNLVYSATGNVIDSTTCDGKVIVQHRRIQGQDEVTATGREAARRKQTAVVARSRRGRPPVSPADGVTDRGRACTRSRRAGAGEKAKAPSASDRLRRAPLDHAEAND